MPSFLGRLPVWAVGGIGVLLLGLVAYGGYALIASRPHVSVATSAQSCGNQPSKLASLFSDGQTTMIRLSNPDYTDMHVLRTEPANALSGMFDPLLSLSGDNSRLAYVTASDELLDNAHVDYVDVSNPGTPVELASVPKGLWVVKPAWSPDHLKLAFIELNQGAGLPDQFELWIADTAAQPAAAAKEADVDANNFTNGNSASLCWTAAGQVVIVPSATLALASPTAAPTLASPTSSPSAATGSRCGVPIFSQNDPAWRAQIMKTGTDSIGGYGCALTSTAMLLNYYGSALTPAQLNSCLGGGADPIAWKSVPACTQGLISGGDRIDFTWTDLDALLASGRPAIVGMIGGPNGSHFVVVTSGGGGLAQSYRITDPWDATTYKTLGSYMSAGFNPRWIISYSGAGRNCARLIKGVAPAITGVQDGGVSSNPVTINLAPNLKNLKVFEIQLVSNGAIPSDTVNQLLPFTKLSPGTTITDEGIYQILVVTQAPSQPPVVQYIKFTIDKTPPAVDLTLLNPRAAGAMLRVWPATGTNSQSSYPVINQPGMVRVSTSDTLSGVQEIKTSLDGGALSMYSSDTTFAKVLVVPQSGDHSLKIQSFDAAGNMKEVTKYFTVYGAVAPPPTRPPSPRPSPTRCTTALTLRAFTVATSQTPGSFIWTTTATWSVAGGCSPFHGTIAGSYTNPASGQLVNLPPHAITALSSSNVPMDQFNCVNMPRTTINYSFVFADSVGHRVSSRASVTVC